MMISRCPKERSRDGGLIQGTGFVIKTFAHLALGIYMLWSNVKVRAFHS